MNVLIPIILSLGSTVVSTTATDATAAWVSGTTYAIGAIVKRDSTHRRYKRAVAGAGTTAPEADPINWIDIGPTNDWAMFDGENNTRTTRASTLSVVLSPGLVNALYIGGLDATGLTVTVKDAPGGTVMATYAPSLEGRAVGDWYDYLFGRFRPLTDVLIEDIPLSPTAEITLAFSSSGTIAVGNICIGDMRELGQTLEGASARLKSYSRVSTDEFGNTQRIKRHTAKTMNATALVATGDAAYVQSILDELDAVPALWVAGPDPDHEPLRVFGMGVGELTYQSFSHRLLTLTAEGLI